MITISWDAYIRKFPLPVKMTPLNQQWTTPSRRPSHSDLEDVPGGVSSRCHPAGHTTQDPRHQNKEQGFGTPVLQIYALDQYRCRPHCEHLWQGGRGPKVCLPGEITGQFHILPALLHLKKVLSLIPQPRAGDPSLPIPSPRHDRI